MQEDEAEEAMKRLMAAKFDFNDFLKQVSSWVDLGKILGLRTLASTAAQAKMMNNMGGAKLLKMLPGMAKVCATLPLAALLVDGNRRCSVRLLLAHVIAGLASQHAGSAVWLFAVPVAGGVFICLGNAGH